LSEGTKVWLLVNGGEAEASARAAVGSTAQVVSAKYGDIWLRDTGPIFAKTPEGPVALRFKTNSWGGKYDLPDDATVGDDIARYAGKPIRRFDFVLEGGAIEHDGQGTVLTTRQTLLNPNRNGWSQEDAEAALRRAFGAVKIIWIDDGLMNDHTDGHIDNIARFVGPSRVVCQSPADADDPNAETLDQIARTLERTKDATGHELETLKAVFPDRKVIGVSSRGLLGCGAAGGGSFHCITQQEPL
jgi:agmatine deiminase